VLIIPSSWGSQLDGDISSTPCRIKRTFFEDFDDLANVNDVTGPEVEPMETELSTERLIGGGGMAPPGEELAITNPSGQCVGELVNQFQKGKASGQVPPSPPPKREQKRAKTVEESGVEKNASNLNLAGSGVEHRPRQCIYSV
jgi:hypothetical protein